MVRPEVIVRRFTSALLDKPWLMGVRRGWLSLMKARVNSWPDVYRALGKLAKFVDGLEDEVMFKRRTPALLQDNRKALLGKFNELREFLASRVSTFKTVQDAAEVGHPPAVRIADEMLDRLRADLDTGLAGAISGREMGMGSRKGSPTELLDRILKMLRDSAAELEKSRQLDPHGTQETWGQEAESEFNLHGMKVVVDDRTVTPQQIKQYVENLKDAYARLKSKGLGKAWYGTVFIQCQECGGVNPNGPQFSVGGWFRIDADTVTVFERPGDHVVQLMAHELGHRYWYRHMTKGQREQFEALVDPSGKDPRLPFLQWKSENDSWLQILEGLSKKVRGKPSGAWDWMFKTINQQIVLGERIFWPLLDTLSDEFPEDTARSVRDQLDFDTLVDHVGVSGDLHMEPVSPATTPEEWDTLLARAKKWHGMVDAVYRRLAEAVEKLKRPVLPVSRYGRSNISEAFAEVFAFYVMNEPMSRDQVDSFKAVMRLASQQDLMNAALNHTPTSEWGVV